MLHYSFVEIAENVKNGLKKISITRMSDGYFYINYNNTTFECFC